jgi:hypothetical protein
MKRSIIKWSLLLVFALAILKVNANGWIKDAPLGIKTDFWATPKSSLTNSNDSGFYSISGASDTNMVLCGTDTCNSSGFAIIKYNDKGNVVWMKPFYPDPNLLQHPLYNDCNYRPLQILFRNYSPQFIVNCNDNSGLIVYYGLEEVVLGQCGGCSECLPVTSTILHFFYAKFDYDGNVIWSQKEIDNEVYNIKEDPFIYGFHNYFGLPEMINIANYNYANSQLSFDIQHQYYDNNLDSLAADLDSFSNIISVDTSIYFDSNVGFRYYNILRTNDGGLLMNLMVVVNRKDTLSYVYIFESYLLKLNANNEKEWLQKIPITNVGITSNLLEMNNKYYIAFRENDLDRYTKKQMHLFSIDNNGNNEKLTSFPNEMNFMHLRNVNNALQLIGSSNGVADGNNDNRIDYSVLFIQFDDNDSATIIKEVKMPTIASFNAPKIIYEEPTIDLQNGSSVFGFRYEDVNNSSNKSVLINIDSLGNVYTTKISGTIFGDKNNNCTAENSDAFLRNYALRAINQTDSFYTSTDTLGKYEMYLDSGNYQMQLLPNPSYPLWKLQNCSIPSTIQLNDGDSATIDIGLTPTISCTNLTVSLTAPMLRRCFENTYYINYCNNGTVNANNAYIDVTLDHFLDFNTSTQTLTNLGNNVFRFNVGNVETGKCGAFSFTATVNCDSTILGQTHCTEAHIFPDTVCSPIPYNGAIIKASASCKTNKVEFKLKNIGGNMQGDRKYIVIQDQVLRSIQNYNLPSGNELIVDVPLQSGATYRIEAEQPANFPSFLGDPKVAAFIEGCRVNANDTFTTGIISQFPLFDGEPYRAIDCQQNRGSYDPNDKAAKPTGVGVEHFIDKNIPLDYTIRFQNTGTDTAFTVSIIDTISAYLDINSIQLSATSHPCNMIRRDTNVIQFLFENIKLVDSTNNAEASNGFVQFHIQQKNNNALGTVINNNASIYFDYNPAIVTNTIFHTIEENYLRIDLISSTRNEAYKNIELSVFPNPFNDKTSLIIKNAALKNPILILLDATGKVVDEIHSSNKNDITIYRNQLNTGIYIYQLKDGNINIATGKIIVQ